MQKKSCAFIDHVYHQKTKSTLFLRELLRNEFDVDDVWISDFSARSIEEIGNSSYDLYVVFQYEFLTPYLLARGKKVISVPMYDGTGEIHPAHWLAQDQALILNHSLRLHRVHKALGLNSIGQLYYPEPAVHAGKPKNYEHPCVFFWERRPSSGLSVRWLASRLAEARTKPTHVHLHLSPDPAESRSVDPSSTSKLFPYAKVTCSTWFESKAEFSSILDRSNVFICSRETEGIGFSFLEAMARGMAVIGMDRPTLSEYVLHGRTGFLQRSKEDPFPDLSARNIAKVGQGAASAVAAGREAWESAAPGILRQIVEYSAAADPAVDRSFSSEHASAMAKAFFGDYPSYIAQAAKLAKNRIAALDCQPTRRRTLRRLATVPVEVRASHLLRNWPVVQSIARTAYTKSSIFKKVLQ